MPRLLHSIRSGASSPPAPAQHRRRPSGRDARPSTADHREPRRGTVMSEHTAVNWLTQQAYDRLTAELEELSGPRRDEVVARIAAAREEGDLKENGGYH